MKNKPATDTFEGEYLTPPSPISKEAVKSKKIKKALNLK